MENFVGWRFPKKKITAQRSKDRPVLIPRATEHLGGKALNEARWSEFRAKDWGSEQYFVTTGMGFEIFTKDTPSRSYFCFRMYA